MDRLLEVYKNDVLAKRLGGESYLQVYNVNMAEIVRPEERKGIGHVRDDHCIHEHVWK